MSLATTTSNVFQSQFPWIQVDLNSLHSFLTLSLCSCFVPVHSCNTFSLAFGAAPKGQNQQQSAPVGVFGVEEATLPGYHEATLPGYQNFQYLPVSVPFDLGGLELPMHSFLALSLYSFFVPVRSCDAFSLAFGAASIGQNQQQSAPVGVYDPELQSATSRFKFVECTAIHARRFKACKCCRSAKVVLPKLTEASNQTSNYLLGRSNAIKLSDSRRAVSSLQLVCAGLTRGFQCRTVRGEGPCVQRRAWRQTDTGRCR